MAYINFRGKKIKPSKPDHPTILKATHLAEFHQIEGFVADRRASQGRLKVPEEKVAQNKNTWIFPKVPQSSIGIPKANLPGGIMKMIHIYWKDQSWCDPNVALVIFWVGICPTKTTMSHSLGWVSWLEWPPTNELFGSFSFRRAVHGDVNFMKKYGQQNCKLRCFYLFFCFCLINPLEKYYIVKLGIFPK